MNKSLIGILVGSVRGRFINHSSCKVPLRLCLRYMSKTTGLSLLSANAFAPRIGNVAERSSCPLNCESAYYVIPSVAEASAVDVFGDRLPRAANEFALKTRKVALRRLIQYRLER